MSKPRSDSLYIICLIVVLSIIYLFTREVIILTAAVVLLIIEGVLAATRSKYLK